MSISSISRRDIEEIYGLENWGAGYFSVSRKGHLMAHTQSGQVPGIDVKAIVDTLGERGLYPPLLLRFPQIIAAQINQLHEAFARAIAEGGYRGGEAKPNMRGEAKTITENRLRIGRVTARPYQIDG